MWGSGSEVRVQGGLVGLGTLGQGGTEVGLAGLAMDLWMLSVRWRWIGGFLGGAQVDFSEGGSLADVDESGVLFVRWVVSACKKDVMREGWLKWQIGSSSYRL